MASIWAFSSVGQELVGDLLEPFGGDVRDAEAFELLQALEHVAEDLVELGRGSSRPSPGRNAAR
jgi:hypothetical protein